MDPNEIRDIVNEIIDEIHHRVVGLDYAVQNILASFFANGHVLLEGVPGIAKSMMAYSLAEILGLDFKRIQFTPDLMPGDITGVSVFNMKTQEFSFIKGPVFSNIILCDEISRAPPKTQAALLEAMQERQTTLEGETYCLDRPFLVLATQNPIEYEGTYPLPEAQIDRFIMRLSVGYPDLGEEQEILNRMEHGDISDIKINKVVTPEQIIAMQDSVQKVYIDKDIQNYIVNIVQATRSEPRVEVGVSPRGSIALFKLSKAHAAFHGRDFVVPDDVKNVVVPALSHRLILKAEARVRGIKPETIINDVVNRITVPTVE